MHTPFYDSNALRWISCWYKLWNLVKIVRHNIIAREKEVRYERHCILGYLNASAGMSTSGPDEYSLLHSTFYCWLRYSVHMTALIWIIMHF